MPVEVILPKVDMDMATGQIARWYVSEGAAVKKGDVLFEIETDKAAMEIDAPASGIVRNISGQERVDIPVGQAVAWIYEAGEAENRPAGPAVPVSAAEAASQAAPSAQALTPAVNPVAQVTEIARGVRATPLARRLARAAGLDLTSLTGSGPNGRIVRADVDEAVSIRGDRGAEGPQQEAPSETADPLKSEGALAEPPETNPVLKLFPEQSYSLVPHDPMRRSIARRLTEAMSTIPHFYLTLDCALDALLALRGELNAAAPLRDGQPAYRLSVNHMVVKAWAVALRDVPDANVSWTETHMVRHVRVDVGVAVSIPGGLITPIVRNADTKTLSVIASESTDLAIRAKARRLRPEEYQGGTTSVSNLGMFGIRQFSAIINPPQATILAVGTGERRAVIVGDAAVPATRMAVTLSADHRAVDGALAAELLSRFKELVENPLAMVV
jgi:pyruvate dehydrogenase E2 component (dihydrolipoamide acetyltransferase)